MTPESKQKKWFFSSYIWGIGRWRRRRLTSGEEEEEGQTVDKEGESFCAVRNWTNICAKHTCLSHKNQNGTTKTIWSLTFSRIIVESPPLPTYNEDDEDHSYTPRASFGGSEWALPKRTPCHHHPTTTTTAVILATPDRWNRRGKGRMDRQDSRRARKKEKSTNK